MWGTEPKKSASFEHLESVTKKRKEIGRKTKTRSWRIDEGATETFGRGAGGGQRPAPNKTCAQADGGVGDCDERSY